jgi:hypothetical protein
VVGAGAADGGIEGVAIAGGLIVVGALAADAGLVGDGIVTMVKVATIDGVGSEASTVGLSASPFVAVGVPGGATVVVVLLPVVVVGAVVMVVDDAGAVVVVGVLVVVAVVGRSGRDSARLRLRALPAHWVVPSGTAPTVRVLSTSVAVRPIGLGDDCWDSDLPPTVAVERFTAKGPTGQSSICGREWLYVEVGFDHSSSRDPSTVAAPVAALTVPVRSPVAVACTVSIPSRGGGVATGTSTGVNARLSLGRVNVPSAPTSTVSGARVLNVAMSVVLERIARLSEIRTGTRGPGSPRAREKHIGPTTTTTTA